MPELPEVETIRRDLSRTYVGQVLMEVAVTGRRTVRRHPAERLFELRGHRLTGIRRHGKYLMFDWDDGQVLVAHLRMSGQLLAVDKGATRAPHTHAVFSFSASKPLHFVDPRTFGEMFLANVPGRGANGVGELSHMGPDALTATAAELRKALGGRRASLKSVLVDQRAIAGIGNIYADEICWRAKLAPDRAAGSLAPREVTRLAAAVRGVLEGAIAARGSTLADKRYRDVDGLAGNYQSQHEVYGREGEPCSRCGRPVQRVRIGAKSAYSCPHCQH